MAPTQERPLTDVVATVTGGGRGLGALLARALAGAGAAVGVVGRTAQDLEATAASIADEGGVAATAAADVTDEARVARAFSQLRERLGPPHVLVNNAGVGGPMGRAWEVDSATWWRAMEVNLRGTLICSRMVLPTMLERGSGRILNITSRAGVLRWPGLSAYSVSKCAVVKLTENLAVDLSGSGVVVLSVDPGLLPIGLTGAAVTGDLGTEAGTDGLAGWIRRQQAEGRSAEPRETAEMIVDLARGRGDALAGRHVAVHDDLGALVDELGGRDEDPLHMLRLAGPDRRR